MARLKKNPIKSPDDFKTFGEYLAYIRETRGYSLRDVEDTISDLTKRKILDAECSVSHGYLRNLESGEVSAPSPFKLKEVPQMTSAEKKSLLDFIDYIIAKRKNDEHRPNKG